jgi:acyl dehydratase
MESQNIEKRTINFESSPIPVTHDMVEKFCEVTGDRQQFHLDPEAARNSFFGTMVSPGLLTTSLAIESMWEMYDKLKIFPDHEVIISSSEVKYTKPVEVGDSVSYKWEMTSSVDKKIKDKDVTIVKWTTEILNSKKEVVSVIKWGFIYVKK